jgi:sugar (glycoside-pentoside-hexuronide) transporter
MSTASGTVKSSEMERLPFWRFGTYGIGQLASNLSWTMVSSYLALFYTDAVGLGAGAVATMLLVTRIWDAANDPIMGNIAERTRTRWGRFRPYIFCGAPVLALITILTFRNPGLSQSGNLVYAYITYTILTMIYTVTNVPYNAMGSTLSRNRNDVMRIGTASMIGMNLAQILLMNITMPLITHFGAGNMSKGYQTTATFYAFGAMLLFWVTVAGTKEVITFTKKSAIPRLESFKIMFKSRNIMCCTVSGALFMTGMMGRIGIMVYYYLHVVRRPDLMGILMSMQMFVGLLVVPFAPALARKIGFRRSAVLSVVIQVTSLLLIYFGDVTNIPYMLVVHVLYGMGYIGGSGGMARDALDQTEYVTGHRIDGTVSGFGGLASKSGGAIGSSIGLFVMGLSGYVGGQEVTPQIAAGINRAVNLIPALIIAASLIPLFLYNLTEAEGKKIHDALEERRDQQRAAEEAATVS